MRWRVGERSAETVGHASPEIADAIAQVARGRLKDFKSYTLANIVKALPKPALHRQCFMRDCTSITRSPEAFQLLHLAKGAPLPQLAMRRPRE